MSRRDVKLGQTKLEQTQNINENFKELYDAPKNWYVEATATGVTVNLTIEGYEEKIGATLILKFVGEVFSGVVAFAINGVRRLIAYHGTGFSPNFMLSDFVSDGDTATFVFDGTVYQLVSVDKKAVEDSWNVFEIPFDLSTVETTTDGWRDFIFNNASEIIKSPVVVYEASNGIKLPIISISRSSVSITFEYYTQKYQIECLRVAISSGAINYRYSRALPQKTGMLAMLDDIPDAPTPLYCHNIRLEGMTCRAASELFVGLMQVINSDPTPVNSNGSLLSILATNQVIDFAQTTDVEGYFTITLITTETSFAGAVCAVRTQGTTVALYIVRATRIDGHMTSKDMVTASMYLPNPDFITDIVTPL
ncbi:MAG: hypothetical protein J1G02_06600 [Clostridiales bacterium]|nr:hypothetical protein [Clostridiales bacterium]